MLIKDSLSKKNIGIIVFGNATGGGIYQYIYSGVEALSTDTQYQYVVFVDRDNADFDHFKNIIVRKFQKKETSSIQKVIRVFQLLFGIQKPYFMQKKELQLYEDIDFFWSPLISPYPHFFLKKPFVITLHDMQERYYPSFFLLQERLIRRILHYALLKRSEAVLCESVYVKNDIHRFTGIDSKKIKVIPAPPTRAFSPESIVSDLQSKIKLKYHLPDIFLYYPAQFWYHKNHISLVRALDVLQHEFPNLHLVFTGSKKNSFDIVKKLIHSLNLEEKIHILGFLEFEEIPYLYSLSKGLIMPSLFESISIPVYEAFGLCVPVISSNIMGLKEQIGDAGILFDPRDVGNIVDAVRLFMNDPQLQEKIAKKGYEKIKTYSYKTYQKDLISLWDSHQYE
jgi:glycosyltransferase involved in cell wall biosynthesis